MASPFRSFVILGAMRTGSNLLETRLNACEGVACHGEVFNPAFIGDPKRGELFGISMAERDRDPGRLLQRLRDAPGLNGFRYFLDHDPRILDEVLRDPACAKIVLTRNPAESYASLGIARTTGQWKLTDAKDRRVAAARFDREEFLAYIAELSAFYGKVRHALQTSGQGAFWIDYAEIGDEEIFGGLRRFIGAGPARRAGAAGLVPQNPEALERKVGNFPAMVTALADIDPFGLFRQPVFEPPRGAAVPEATAMRGGRVLFLPLRGGPNDLIRDWLGQAGGAGVERGFTQKSLRQWMRERPGHTRFTVLWHPVLRAFSAFEALSATGEDRLTALAGYGVTAVAADAPPDERRRAFLAFVSFLRANINGQTGVRTAPEWASQAALLSGMTAVACPDVLFRAADLGNAELTARFLPGTRPAGPPPIRESGLTARLDAIYDSAIESAVADAYGRDYVLFGFAPWQPGQAG